MMLASRWIASRLVEVVAGVVRVLLTRLPACLAVRILLTWFFFFHNVDMYVICLGHFFFFCFYQLVL